MPERVVVVGGGMAAVRLAELLVGADVHLTLLADEPHAPYNRILLSAVLEGTHRAEALTLRAPEWFAARAPQVARQARAADRKRLIAEMKAAGDPLIADYERAAALAETAMRRARKVGDYPLLSRGDFNIYSLFVERAQGLIKPEGIAGLLVPSGIASGNHGMKNTM